jgi:hypothetical protein
MARLVQNKMDASLKKLEQKLQRLPAEAFKFWVAETPIKSGNARRKTSLVNKKTIWAKYPYAKRLNEGWSKQAPEGMVEPTTRFIIRKLRQILRK